MKTFTCLCLILILIAVVPGRSPARELNLAAMAYPPFTGKGLPGKGLISEIAVAAFERRGHTANVKILPWKRAVEMTKKGLFDGILSLVHKKEREKWFIYSVPLPPIHFSFMKQSGAPDPVRISPDGLGHFIIGMPRGYAAPDTFEAIIDKLAIRFCTDECQGLKMLAAGRIDLMLVEANVASYLVRNNLREYQGKIQLINRVLFAPENHYIGISRQIPDAGKLAADYNSEYARMAEDGTLAALLIKHDIH